MLDSVLDIPESLPSVPISNVMTLDWTVSPPDCFFWCFSSEYTRFLLPLAFSVEDVGLPMVFRISGSVDLLMTRESNLSSVTWVLSFAWELGDLVQIVK